jgi:pyridoxamine 5'-phosphate oxidase
MEGGNSKAIGLRENYFGVFSFLRVISIKAKATKRRNARSKSREDAKAVLCFLTFCVSGARLVPDVTSFDYFMKIETRSEYTRGALEREQLKASPFDQFALWLQETIEGKVIEPNAMSLATVGADQRPLTRTVLLKSFDERGFVFFTNFESRKGRQIEENPNVSLLFPWLALERQVIVCGAVEKVSTEEARAYFATRPRGSQLGAWVSAQSSVIMTRELLEEKLVEITRKFGEEEVPLPPFWGGFRVVPREIEFWQGRASRLHDRFLYSGLADGAWRIERLAP